VTSNEKLEPDVEVLDFTQEDPVTPKVIRDASTAPRVSENPMVTRTTLLLVRSGRIEIEVAVGGVVSTTTLLNTAALEDDWPLNSCDTEKLQVPSVNSFGEEKVQDSTDEVAVKVQVLVADPLVAVTVTAAPTTKPPTEIAGVVSLVTLSVVNVSVAGVVSDPATRSGVNGRLIAIGPAELLSPTVEPVALVPVTRLRMKLPTSAAARVYVLEVAPEIVVQVTPSVDLCHVTLVEVAPTKVTAEVNVWPTVSVPVGAAEL
jgi:hypothetical protein